MAVAGNRWSILTVVFGCGIQAREPGGQIPRMELNGAVGMVAANVKVEFAGTAKSAWNR